MTSRGDWLVLQELLERGDLEFVNRLRSVDDADALGKFAERWYSNPSPNARRLLLAYLERPFNAYRHEALVKRLFKRAEAEGDDAVMARFLVCFDRSIRRVIRQLRHREHAQVDSREEAERLVAQWKAQGFDEAYRSGPGEVDGRFHVWGTWSEPIITTPGGTTMPRGAIVSYPGYQILKGRVRNGIEAPDWVRSLKLDPQEYRTTIDPPESSREKLGRFRLFSVATRHYLRRRAWRYFRKLGKDHPERYVAAISVALVLYQDADADSGLAFLDNWGLVHALFHHSPVLEALPRGWRLAEDRSLSELEPAPIFDELWRSSPRALFNLVGHARCRPVTQWAVKMLKRDPAGASAAASLEELIGLLGHADPEIVEFAAACLRESPNLAAVSPERWLGVAEAASPETVEMLAEIIGRHLAADRVTLQDAVRLAACRPLPLARLGLGWLKSKTPNSDDERRGLFLLLEARSEPLRPEILAWLRSALADPAAFRPEWVLEFLDSRHADARAEGLRWFREEPHARDDVTLWQRLLESPYDDVRLALVTDLDARLSRANLAGVLELSRVLDPERLRLLWASVLLNVRRGGRVKPGVVQQVAQRLAGRPDEAEQLLPLLGLALRSVRAPERRAALAAVVRLVEDRPDAISFVRKALPELQWA